MEISTIINIIIIAILVIILLVFLSLFITFTVKYTNMKKKYDTDIAAQNAAITQKDKQIAELQTANATCAKNAENASTCQKDLSTCTTNKKKVEDDFGKCTFDLDSCKGSCDAKTITSRDQPKIQSSIQTMEPAQLANAIRVSLPKNETTKPINRAIVSATS